MSNDTTTPARRKPAELALDVRSLRLLLADTREWLASLRPTTTRAARILRLQTAERTAQSLETALTTTSPYLDAADAERALVVAHLRTKAGKEERYSSTRAIWLHRLADELERKAHWGIEQPPAPIHVGDLPRGWLDTSAEHEHPEGQHFSREDGTACVWWTGLDWAIGDALGNRIKHPVFMGQDKTAADAARYADTEPLLQRRAAVAP